MTKPRALVVDDEPLARARLTQFLQRQDAVAVAGECGDGLQALATIEREKPEIVFLDVQMPGCSGLEVAKRLPATARPAIIFVTAYDRFAVDAFATSAVDYLLKPFDDARFQQALERAFTHLSAHRARNLEEKLESLLINGPPRGTQCLALRVDGRILFVRPRDVVWIEAANNYSVLHLVDARRLMLREALGSLEQRLGHAGFVRIHRSAVVQVDQIRELEPTSCGDHLVVLQNGTKLPLSRYLRRQLEEALNEPG